MDKQKARKEFADRLLAKYKDFGIVRKEEHWIESSGIEQTGISLFIKNPLDGEYIRVMYDGNHVNDGEVILSYGKWHNHFYDFGYLEGKSENYDGLIEDISKYIYGFLQGKKAKEI
jgi:hypothetical protein